MSLVIYTINGCKFCKDLITLLNERGISYEEKNVDKEKKFLKELKNKNLGNFFPVMDTGKKIIEGFDKEKIKRELKIK